MDNQQLSIMIQDKVEEKHTTLHIIYNNECVDWGIRDIFDTNKYNKFIGITYSVDPNFVNKYLSDFDESVIVIGLPSEKLQYDVNQMAKNIQETVKNILRSDSIIFYEALSLENKHRLANKNIDIKIPLGYSIHSKFYLLKNTLNNETRIILGSANLTDRAFNKNVAQFENILIFDNNLLFDIYQDYYEKDISSILTNYFPKELMVINSKRFKNKDIIGDEKRTILVLSNEEVEKIKEKDIVDKLETTQEKVDIFKLPEKVLDEIKNLEVDRSKLKNNTSLDKKLDDTAYSIVKEATNNKLTKPKIKTKSSLQKSILKNIEPLKVKSSENSLDREELYSKADLRSSHKDISGLIIKSSLDEKTYIDFGRRASFDEIRSSLVNINRFLNTFEKYVHKYNDEYGQRIMETIFYAFTSPFLYEIKRLSRTTEERHDIPQFLFIGGVAGSGKSSLLKMISKLMGISDKAYWTFSELASGPRAKSGRVDVINSWVSEENVNPILLDEIAIEFFTQQNYGRELILNTTNNKVEIVDAFPTVIGTTNADGYSLPAEARRRSYYLKIDKVFSELFREESPIEYQEIYEGMDNLLFQDFVLRMSYKLENWQDFNWSYFGEKGGKVDFLHETREIFKEYYRIVEMPLPRYFPTDRYSDDFETNQEKWRKLYKGTSSQYFKFDEVTGNLFFKTSSIDENMPRLYGRPESEIYKQALPQFVVHGSISGIDIELDTLEFFKWLEIDNPYENYYKSNLVELYNSKINELEITKDYIKFPFDILSHNYSLIKKYSEVIPKEIVKETSDSHWIFSKDIFLQWANIDVKDSFFDKIFKSLNR